MHLVEDNLLGKLYRSCAIGDGKLSVYYFLTYMFGRLECYWEGI